MFRSGPFVNSTIDYRLYRRATSRSLLALRLVGVVSNGRGFNIYSMLVAVVGAVVVLWLYHMLIGRRAL